MPEISRLMRCAEELSGRSELVEFRSLQTGHQPSAGSQHAGAFGLAHSPPGSGSLAALDAIKSVVDPIWRRKSERLRRAHGREYGAPIAAVRKERGLKQTEVPGISERQLRRIEQSGDISVCTLKQLAEAHGMTLEDYLNALAGKVRRSSKDGRIRPTLSALAE
jgi:hypothetical protein